MKKQTFTLILFLNINLLQAQNPLVKEWDYRYGGTGIDYLNSIQQTSDGGYILGGQSRAGGGDKTPPFWGGKDYYAVKLDSLGIKQWDRSFGGLDYNYFYCLQQTNDGGYILGGFSDSDSGGCKSQHNRDTIPPYTDDYWIVKIDSLGNQQWDKTFGGKRNDILTSLAQTTDGGYILGGRSESGISGDKTQNCRGWYDYWAIKIDSLGNKQWDKRFGGSTEDELYSVQQTFDGGYILGGWSTSDSSGDKTENCRGSQDYWIVKINSSGIKQWDKTFGGSSFDNLCSLTQTVDGGYIAGGLSGSGISGDKTEPNCFSNYTDYWIVKMDALGNKQWDRDIGGMHSEDDFGNISQTSDGGYLIAGTSYSDGGCEKSEFNLGLEQTWIIKTDSLGIKQWDKTIFTIGHDEQGLALQSGYCYVFANSTAANIGGYKTQPQWDTLCSAGWCYSDFWIIKFCDTTLTTSINQISNSQSSILIYPNPTNAVLSLSLNHEENIAVTNLLGEIVLQKTTEGKVELDVSFLSAGIYFIKAGNEVRKFVKE